MVCRQDFPPLKTLAILEAVEGRKCSDPIKTAENVLYGMMTTLDTHCSTITKKFMKDTIDIDFSHGKLCTRA